jgi:hypothetical protein
MQSYVYRARVATTQSQDKVPLVAAGGEVAVVSGHSPLCRASVGIVKPPTEPPRAAIALPVRDAIATRWLGVPRLLLMLCTDKNVLGSDYETSLYAGQGVGRLEFTCLLPERVTKWITWVMPLAREPLTVAQLMLWLDMKVCGLESLWLARMDHSGHMKCTDSKGVCHSSVSPGDAAAHVSSSKELIQSAISTSMANPVFID